MSDYTEIFAYESALNGPTRGRQLVASDGYQGMLVTENLPRGVRLAQGSRTYVASAGVVANAIVCVVDVPTTAAKWALYNSAATTTKTCLVIHRVSMYHASGTADTGASLLIGMSTAIQSSAVSANTGSVVKSTSCSTRASVGVLGGATTLAGAAAWEVVAAVPNAAAATVGSGAVSADLTGQYIVRPNWALGFAVLSGLGTTAKWGVTVSFSEIELDMAT